MSKKESELAEAFAPFIEAKKALDKQIREGGKKAVKKFFTKYFEAHPEIKGVTWTQYTPYFNDGEECVFGLHAVHILKSDAAVEKIRNGESAYSIDDGDDVKEVYGEGLYHTLQEVEDLLQQALGDHAQILATPDEIIVEEYEHD